MKYETLVEQCSIYPILTPALIKQYFPQSNYRSRQLSERTAKWRIIQLKKGYYLLTKHHHKTISLFELARYLIEPSYISLQSALSYHGMIPEWVYTTTSITTKNTITLQTPLWEFAYHHCRPVQLRWFQFIDGAYIATSAKALADYCRIYKNTIWPDTIESLRLSFPETFDTSEFLQYIQQYNKKTFQEIINLYILPYLP